MSRRKYNRITVEVTSDHISTGQRLSSTHDPIALALHDKGFKKVNVGLNVIIFDGRVPVGLTHRCKSFMRRFDLRRKVKPFKFTVLVPVEVTIAA